MIINIIFNNQLRKKMYTSHIKNIIMILDINII